MKKQVVLIVEEESKMLDIMAETLRGKFVILTAPNGSHAVKVLKLCPVDVVIADMEMTNTGSLELLQEIAGNKTNLKTVLMERASGLPVKKLCNELNLNAHITESYSVDTVSEVLRAA